MDNLGVAMNATTIEAYALSKGIKTSYNEMTNAQKVELAMQMFLEKSAYATGNYVKENDTFAGSFNTLKASMQNFLSGAGDVNQLIDSVMGFSEVLLRSIGETAPRIVEGIIGLVNGIAPQLPSILEKLLPVVIQGAIDLINGLVKMLPTIIPILMNGIVDAIKQISKVLPDILNALIQATIIIINGLADEMDTLIPILVDAFYQIIPILLQNLPLFIEAGWKLFIGLGKGMLNSIPVLVSNLPKVWGAIFNYLKNLPNEAVKIGGMLVKGLWEGIKNVKNWLFEKISSFAKGVTDKIKKIFGIKSPSRVFRDEIGKNLALGLGEGFERNINDVYRQMQNAIDFEQSKLQANVETGSVFNTLQNSTPIAIDINAPVELDGTKVGRVITPVISKTIKTGGGV